MSYEAKLKEMGYKIDAVDLDKGRLMLAKRSGNLIFTSGSTPNRDGKMIKGKVGRDLTTEEGYEAAKIATLNCLDAIKTLVALFGDNSWNTFETFVLSAGTAIFLG